MVFTCAGLAGTLGSSFGSSLGPLGSLPDFCVGARWRRYLEGCISEALPSMVPSLTESPSKGAYAAYAYAYAYAYASLFLALNSMHYAFRGRWREASRMPVGVC